MNIQQLNSQIDKLYENELKLHPPEERKFDPSTYEHFHTKHKNSNTLLFCLGDSYTYGSGLQTEKWIDELRIKNMFGTVVSNSIEADLINAGAAGFSNSWVFVNLEFMIDWLNNSDYTNGYIVITFTENGRDIRTASHRMFDYISTYKDVSTDKLYDQVLSDIEDEWTDRLIKIRKKIDPRFKFILGAHYVWHNKLYQRTVDIDGIHWIQNTWIELLASSLSKHPPPRVPITNLSILDSLNGILSIQNLSDYKSWFVNNTDDPNKVHNWFESTPEYFEPHDIGHPNAAGHQIWADVIIEKVKELDAHFKIYGSES